MQIITKGGKLFCTTMRHYPPEIVAQIKREGYKVKETESDAGKTQSNSKKRAG